MGSEWANRGTHRRAVAPATLVAVLAADRLVARTHLRRLDQAADVLVGHHGELDLHVSTQVRGALDGEARIWRWSSSRSAADTLRLWVTRDVGLRLGSASSWSDAPEARPSTSSAKRDDGVELGCAIRG